MKTSLAIAFLLAFLGAQSEPVAKTIPAIAKSATGSIVSIIVSDKNGHRVAQGSGFIISRDGRIVTNYHVIKNGYNAIAKLPDGKSFSVDGMLTFDKKRDVAVLKAHGDNFHTVSIGNSDHVQVGEEIVAIGNPFSLESTVSSGIVSGIRAAQKSMGRFLQITAPISPGSSGGPLFNMAGEVVGITTLYIQGGENLNFAIPINDVKQFLGSTLSTVSHLPAEPLLAKKKASRLTSSNVASYLWVARYTGKDSAEAAEKKIEDLGLPAGVSTKHGSTGDFYIVYSGPFLHTEAASKEQQLKKEGFSHVHVIAIPTASKSPAK